MKYKVRPEESLISIATRCGISVADLLKANPAIKKQRKIFVGQEVRLPPLTNVKRPSCAGGSRPSFGGGGRPSIAGAPPDNSGTLNWAWAKAGSRTGGNAPQTSSQKNYSTSIKIDGPASFVRRVRSELGEIAKTSVGAKLLGPPGTSVAAVAGDAWRSKFKVVIRMGKTCRAEPTHIMNGWKKGSYIMYDHLGLPVTHGNKGTGRGCVTKLEYNPALALPSVSWLMNMPTALLLAHELIHAYLYARGEADPKKVDNIRNHERQVVGLPPFENGEITENKLRGEWNPPQPKRSQYTKQERN
jgi:LysM repeat protein